METLDSKPQVAGDTLIRSEAVSLLLRTIGEDTKRQGLKETPARVSKAWDELTAGYRMEPSEILKTQFEIEEYDQMILLKNIDFFSMCEHHLMPFFGTAHIAYVPSEKKVVGLSKLARLTECYARRLQIQERMTHQIGSAIMKLLRPRGCGVVIKAKHTCMISRGIAKPNAEMTTSFISGVFSESAVRQEFLKLIE